MGKKVKSKQRLDPYYHYAKSQGYRSRAAYKLIQLNRKYNFLNSSTTLIDLCAAPGGWMQIAAQFMPLQSTIIGVDLDPIKKIPGTISFQGDITTKICYDRLRKQLEGRKCDVVLNDGAPNVGANWSKDAYSQNELVLSALQLACSFLREGGYFVTKVFRSTDFNSVVWVLNKFFQKVEVTKPKASRFTSAEIFIVCIGYLAPTFIDEKLFDAKYIFKDTQADHFQNQMLGQITSIDKLLENRRKRGGYEDNAPMHLYKQISLTDFIESQNPLVIFAQFNKITISPQEREKYLSIQTKRSIDFEQCLNDLKVLGKREIGNIIKWRGKVKQQLYKNNIKIQNKNQQEHSEQQEEEDNSEDQLEQEMLNQRKKQLRNKRNQEEKTKDDLVRAQFANVQHHDSDQQFEQQILQDMINANEDIQQLQYEQLSNEEKKEDKLPKYISYTNKQLEDNLEQLYQIHQKKKSDKQQQIREARQQKKQRKQTRIQRKQYKLHSRRFEDELQAQEEQNKIENQQYNQRKKQRSNKNNNNIIQSVKFQNPLKDFDDEDIYLSQEEKVYDDNLQIDPNQKMEGELSDDDAYVIPKPLSDMEKRRKQLKKQRQKQQKKLKKGIEEGNDTGGQIQYVKQKKMEDYNIDQLAQTLAIGKKMLRNTTRQLIIDSTYNRYAFEDHDNLPKWFTEDQKKHNYKKVPITKEQFLQEKERLAAINARIPKKILEAKVRKKIRIQKKLKKVQKKAENVMSQQGLNQVSKLRQVSRMYDREKRQLKDKKKYIIGKKGKAVGKKDGRNVKHVDARLKKDKRSQIKSKRIKKTRHLKRKNKSKGKF